MLMFVSLVIGKIVAITSRLFGNSGTAISGKVIEKINPRALNILNSQLEYGVIVVTGTNGKTSTTKMISDLLEALGYRVFTNKSGSNFTRGVLSAIASKYSILKRNLNCDIGVVEMDEAHFKHFAKQVSPQVTLVTNLFRDQLDRYGEVESTAWHIAQGLSKSKKVVLYGNDDKVQGLKSGLSKKVEVQYFGVSAKMRRLFPNDDELHGEKSSKKVVQPKKAVTLSDYKNDQATYNILGKKHTVKLQTKGVFNALNLAAALSSIITILPDTDIKSLMKLSSKLQPAFGRNEEFKVSNKSITLSLVKNPAGFNHSVSTLLQGKKAVLFIVNDNFADGRDVSWYWDVNVESLQKADINIYVAGVRRHDFALMLQYNDLEAEVLTGGVEDLLEEDIVAQKRVVVFATYTAMIETRKVLIKASNDKRSEVYE